MAGRRFLSESYAASLTKSTTRQESGRALMRTPSRKMLTRLGQNGTWSGPGAPNSPGADDEPPAKSRDPPHPVTSAERGKPVALPARESDSQEEPTGRRVKDEGGSERRPVTGRIGVEPRRRHHPTRKRADFPRVFRHERTSANRLREQSRYVGGGNACWCGSRPCGRLAFHRLEEGPAHGPSAPGAYREGGPGGQVE